MAKLIPGRVRNLGIELYDKGLVSILEVSDSMIEAAVDDYQLTYALDDTDILCDCQLFHNKGYCEHLAALEHYLKNDKEGQLLLADLEEGSSVSIDALPEHSFGSLFLDSLTLNEDDTIKYSLSVKGEQEPYSSGLWWTLRIRRWPDERSYVVRDIPAFLRLVSREGFYQIGKNYYEALSMIQFDQASQDFLNFLDSLIPDDDKLDLEFIFPNHGRYLTFPHAFFEEGVTLLQNLEEFSLDWQAQTYSFVSFEKLTAAADLFSFEVSVGKKQIELIINEKDTTPFFDNQFLFYQNIFYTLNRKQQKLVAGIRSLPINEDLKKHVFFHLEEQSKLAASLFDFQHLGSVKAPKTFEIRDFTPHFDFNLSSADAIALSVTFDFAGILVDNQKALNQLGFTSNFRHEKAVFRLMEQQGFTPGFQSGKLLRTAEELYNFFMESLPAFKAAGQVTVSQELEAQRLLERPQVQVGRNGSLLDISFDFSDLADVDVDQALQALMANTPYFVNRTGQLIIFDEETHRISESLQNLRARHSKEGRLQLNQLATYQLLDAMADKESVSFSDDFYRLAQHLRRPETFELPEFDVKTELRPYQKRGVQWLSMLHHYGFGGVLADDMGLGKTLQTIAYLSAHLNRDERVLVLTPSSLIYNWQDEFNKFAPQLDVTVSYGLKQKREELIAEDHQVTITSYASFRQDIAAYKSRHYDYLILDEAQVIKNAQTKIAQHLRDFDVKHCFALSGTPIENHLLEIWSIFQIILPGLLPTKKAFMKLSAKDVARYISPFVLRRRKEEVLPDLPDLIEINHRSELSDNQKVIYLAQLQQMQQRVLQSSDQEINQQKIEILSGITRLRQICDTPALFMNYSGDSGKLDSLRELLLQIKESDHRVLVFSQFRGMLDIAEHLMTDLEMSSYKLTGSTPSDSRQEMTRAFNQGSRDAFLISLKAGGVGLNLTGADTVILIDLWWNPAVEMQAISRAHRIGQEQNVEVYRLITRGTIEEKILELQENKKNLVTTVLDGNESRASMSVDEIKEILGLKESD
ncbi:DEAD/DEAH box helicase [Streptococcus dentiloxodontae]